MKKLKLVKPDNPALLIVSAVVGIADGLTIGDKMWDYMYKHYKRGGAVGVAAPQFGINKQVFIWSLNDWTNCQIAINPRMINRGSFKQSQREGCLSLPKYNPNIARSQVITMRYNDGDIEREKDFTGVEARVIQHEFDHLLGILINNQLR